MFGAENVVLEIAKNSERYGYNSIVGALKDYRDPYPEILKVAKKRYQLETILFENKKIFDLNSARMIREYVLERQIAILHCHGYKEDFFGLLSGVKVPKVATNHLWKRNTFKLRLYRLADACMMHFFDQVVGVSDGIVNEMRRFGIRGVYKIPNGIDTERFRPTPKSQAILKDFCLEPNNVVLGMVSSLSPEKNHKLALEALSCIGDTNIKLLIVGAGPEEDALKRKVLERGLQRSVIFTGTQEKIEEILSIIDIFLLPSLAEGLPIALLEAMACGKAVIASNVGENSNVIIHGENGLLIKPEDLSGLVKSIDLLLKNKSLIKIYGKKARETVVKKYSSIEMTKNYCIMYNRVLGN